jgi:hypothetical protein
MEGGLSSVHSFKHPDERNIVQSQFIRCWTLRGYRNQTAVCVTTLLQLHRLSRLEKTKQTQRHSVHKRNIPTEDRRLSVNFSANACG